jgi:hypothetical protein
MGRLLSKSLDVDLRALLGLHVVSVDWQRKFD